MVSVLDDRGHGGVHLTKWSATNWIHDARRENLPTTCQGVLEQKESRLSFGAGKAGEVLVAQKGYQNSAGCNI